MAAVANFNPGEYSHFRKILPNCIQPRTPSYQCLGILQKNNGMPAITNAIKIENFFASPSTFAATVAVLSVSIFGCLDEFGAI